MRSEADENAPDEDFETDPASSTEPESLDSTPPEADGENGAGPEGSEPTTDLAPVPEGPGAQVDRLTDVLLAADQAAAEILDAARAEASDFVAETQRSTIERAESLRRETDNLMSQTAELTAKVVELTRATEQVMEGFRAELSLDAPEVREETLTPALPEPTPAPAAPEFESEPAPTSIEDIAPEDTSLAPEPVIADSPRAGDASVEEPGADDTAPIDDPASAGDSPVEEPAVEEIPAGTTDQSNGAAATTESASIAPEPAVTTPTPASPPEPPVEATPEPKRRGGLFGRFRGRGKEQASPAAPSTDPTPQPTPTEEAPAPDARSGPVTEGARLIARQMLATGLGEEEVKRQLREQFRLADPQAVLDSLRRNDRDDQSG